MTETASHIGNKLFLVSFAGRDDDGNDYDDSLFVIAANAADAVEIWRKENLESLLEDETDDGATNRAQWAKEANDHERERWNAAVPDNVWLIHEETLLCRAPRALWWGREIERIG